MKASDIKKLIEWGSDSYDYRLTSLSGTIQEWEVEEELELCPTFQRGHVWTQPQQIAFVEYILRGGKTSSILLNDKTRSEMVLDSKGNLIRQNWGFVCVDGLQRLTALMLFLDDKLPAFGHTRSQIEGIELELRSLHINVRINCLATDREVLKWYLELNAGGTPHTEAELDRVRDLLKLC
jgi:hypothetical protein